MMRPCSNCNELNGKNRRYCYQCNTFLGPVDQFKKVCRSCGSIFEQKVEHCNKCGILLSVYSGDTYDHIQETDDGEMWMFVVSVIIPLLGIVLGLIYIVREQDDLGKSLIITSIVSNIIIGILLAIIF